MIINEGFSLKRSKDDRLPPGQYEVRDFPVLSLGPTPDIDRDNWCLEITGLVAKPHTYTWKEINTLPQVVFQKDIHCVTKWSKFDTHWSGVSFDTIMDQVGVSSDAAYLIAHSADGYTTNLPLEDVRGGKALIALSYEGEAIEASHGGPVRLVVPHLYFWKSAKWLTKLEFVDRDIPGFWENRGYHNYGDPWKEERYDSD